MPLPIRRPPVVDCKVPPLYPRRPPKPEARPHPNMSIAVGIVPLEQTRIVLAADSKFTTNVVNYAEKLYAMLVKLYGTEQREAGAPEWYGPPRVIAALPTPIMGKPVFRHISTSFIERQNLTVRMQARRFTRLTNAFSKKLENLKAQVALHFAHYNWFRIHQTLRVTPAMEARLTDHVWSLGELLSEAA